MPERLDCPKCKAPLESHEVVTGVVVNNCAACFGVMYAVDDLAVPLKLSGAAPARFDCPKCRRPMETATAYDGKLEVDRCAACSVLWFDAGEIQILRKLSGVENLAGKPADIEAQDAPAAAVPSSPAAPLKKTTTDDEPRKSLVPPEMSGAKNPDQEHAPTVTLDGRAYQHFQTSVPVTTSVLGEFPWVAKIGDSARMRDFIAPPFLLSQEVTATEAVWSVGEYLEPEEVWSAFALPGAPPAKIGVAAAQPNPWTVEMPAIWMSFWLAAAMCVGVYILMDMTAAGRAVYTGSFTVAATDIERSRVSDVFEVSGRTSNLEVDVDTNLDGQWAYVSMALIDADTDKALDFGRDMSYYHGYEDGESWSEGGSREIFYVPSVPAGRYYLRIEPETDSPALNLRIGLKRDVPLKRLPLIAIIFLVLPAVWAGMRQSSFENTRWMDSDHPRTSSDDDGDDD